MSTRLPDDDSDLDVEHDTTPDDIALFIAQNNIAEKHSLVLKQVVTGSKPHYIRGFSGADIPTLDEIGEQWGPGEYELTFTWKEKGVNGKSAPVSKCMRVSLPESAWRDIHTDYLARKNELKLQKERAHYQSEAERARAFGNPSPQMAPASDLDTLKKAAETLKSLGVPIGGHVKQQTDWATALVNLAPAITAAAPILVALIGRKKDDGQGPLLQMVLGKLLESKPQGDSEYMKQAFGFIMGGMKNMLEMKQAMQPEEKEPFIERVFDKLVGSMPMVLELAKMSKPQREANMMYKMAQGHPDVQTVMSDLELQIALVNKLDSFYGFEQTNQILEVMGVPRPAVTRENAKHYASPQSSPKAPEPSLQEDLRNVPQGDAPKTSKDEEDELPS